MRLGRFIYNTGRLEVTETGLIEEGELRLLRQMPALVRHWKGSRTVLDIGANLGHWARFCSDRLEGEAKDCRIFCFEPNSGAYEELKRNLSAWGLAGRILPYRLAMSSAAGPRSLHCVGAGQGRNSLHAPDDAQFTEQVECSTLDEWCRAQAVEDVFYMKIDTEGHDVDVLLGAKALLSRHAVCALQFEYNSCWISSRHFLRDAFDLLGPLGYRLGRITRAGVEFHGRWHPALERFTQANYLAVGDEHAVCFPKVPPVVL
jgi:FkbM family methyltransferase